MAAVFDGHDVFFSPSLTFGEAKRWATEQVRRTAGSDAAGLVVVSVLP
jgi:hypothetical protein